MMALLYATYIMEGKWTYDKVAYPWKEEVKAILIAEGREDLVTNG